MIPPRYSLILILASAIFTQVTSAQDFPFARGTFNDSGKLAQWSLERVRAHRDTAIGKLDGLKSNAEKDNAADSSYLAYSSPIVEEKVFETELDLTEEKGVVFIAIQVDDLAALLIDEKLTGNEPANYSPVEETFVVEGTALWNKDRSYREFSRYIPAGRKYDLTLIYRNTANLTDKYNGFVDYDGVNVFMMYLPVEVVELAPKLIDENGKSIPNSEKPAAAPEANEMVEIDPLASPKALTDASNIRIAWRDIKVKFDKLLVGKKITWSMNPLYTPSVVKSTGPAEVLAPDPKGPRFRGSWDHAEETASKDAFSPSIAYGKHDWVRLLPTSGSTPGTATTIVKEEGYTAIRVNLPPIGFNKAKIKIAIEGLDFEIDLIDLVVPAVVVIDPGHGGLLASKKIGGSSPNNAYSYGSAPPPSDPKRKRKINETMADYRAILDPRKADETHEQHWARLSVSLEKDISLKYGIGLKSSLHERFASDSNKARILMTRSIDKNLEISSRAKIAKLNGADIFFSIHYNSDVKDWVRGPEVILRSKVNSNLNHAEDMAFAERILNTLDSRVPEAPIKVENTNYKDELPDYRGIKQYPTNPTGVDKDSSLGNSEIGPCSHACLAEIEFMTSPAVEKSVVSGLTADDVSRSLCKGFAIAISNDIHARKGER